MPCKLIFYKTLIFTFILAVASQSEINFHPLVNTDIETLGTSLLRMCCHIRHHFQTQNKTLGQNLIYFSNTLLDKF